MKHVKLFQKFDFQTVLEKKDKNFKVSDDISDQILTAFIIRYVRSKEDAEYVIDIINNNKERRTFISIFINEFDTLYSNVNNMPAGKTKDAINHLGKMITDEKYVDSDLIEIVVTSFLDVM
jgi:hypothetical protein